MSTRRSYEACIEFLRARRAGTIGHSNRCLLDHLIGTRNMLLAWNARPALCYAGLFHSVYSTEHFDTQSVAPSARAEIQSFIGDESEHLVWLFCVMRRSTFNDNLHRREKLCLQNRIDGSWIPLSREQFSDLATLSAANALESLPHLRWFQRQRLREACKRYLSRFNDCVLPHARQSVEAACVPWWNVWS